MATTRGTVNQFLMDAAVDQSVTMTAEMLGMPEETVRKILQVGLPMMARMADENPALLKAMYAQSLQLMPEPVQQFYGKLAESPKAQQKLVDEFQTMVGPMMESLSRETAVQAGSTPALAGSALATTYPAVAQALGKGNTEQTEAGFGQRLKELVA
ncbi:MAG: hypothetical protein JNM64_02690 [Chloroflexia bacterium]|nr:hypothetical protein [Chloroflexia bacterium]